jgi:hypothetical protein
MFILQGSGLTFLVAENVFWALLYLASAYLCYRTSRYRAIVMLVAGANAGRVSRSIVDPFGVLGTEMIEVHSSLLIVITLLGLLVLMSILAETHSS